MRFELGFGIQSVWMRSRKNRLSRAADAQRRRVMARHPLLLRIVSFGSPSAPLNPVHYIANLSPRAYTFPFVFRKPSLGTRYLCHLSTIGAWTSTPSLLHSPFPLQVRNG